MGNQLTAPRVLLNDEAIAIVPNSFAFTEGLGEQDQVVASLGGGDTEEIFQENVESSYSMVKFSVYPTAANIERLRSAKQAKNNNVLEVTVPGEDFSRVFQKAIISNNYEPALGAGQTTPIEFKTKAAI